MVFCRVSENDICSKIEINAFMKQSCVQNRLPDANCILQIVNCNLKFMTKMKQKGNENNEKRCLALNVKTTFVNKSANICFNVKLYLRVQRPCHCA